MSNSLFHWSLAAMLLQPAVTPASFQASASQNGGRLMQVVCDDHAFFFVNRKYAGTHLPPSNSEWFNYGGDKLWVLPEGSEDEQHWAGNSDLLDDGLFEFQILSQGQRCEISLTG